MKEYIIGKNEANQRLDKYLHKLLKEASNGFLYKMLRKKNITLNGKKAEGVEKLQEGDHVKLFLSDETFLKFAGQPSVHKDEANVKLKPVSLSVVYEDEDILIINKELENYSPELIKRPQVIAANKTDGFYGTEEDTVITLLKEEFEPKGIPVFPISAVSGKGVKELLYYVKQQLDQLDQEPVVFEQEYDLEQETFKDEPYTVEYDEKEGMYVVEGPRIERMLGYTNLDSEKGFEFFQKFLRTSGIVDELEKLGIEEGDTVRMYGLQFDYLR